ncbi:unnamed protein product, partial [Gulo gulo]
LLGPSVSQGCGLNEYQAPDVQRCSRTSDRTTKEERPRAWQLLGTSQKIWNLEGENRSARKRFC